jgi:hypothetical protein
MRICKRRVGLQSTNGGYVSINYGGGQEALISNTECSICNNEV